MRILLIYYSRSNVTDQLARDIKDVLGKSIGSEADIVLERIGDSTSRKGVTGYIKAGYAAFKKKETIIHPLQVNVGNFDLVCVGTPVWANNMAPAIRTFLGNYGRKINQVAFFCSQGGSGGEKAMLEMGELLDLKPISTLVVLQKLVAQKPEAYFKKIEKFVKNLLN